MKHKDTKIVFMVLPYLTPLCPPVGISSLKSYLKSHGYTNVKTIDVMLEFEIRQECYTYFSVLSDYIPENKRSSYFNVGLDVLANHFMAHINQVNLEDYIQLVKDVVYYNFYVQIDDEQVSCLNTIVAKYYDKLAKYIAQMVETEQPEIVGLSTYKGTLHSSLFTARLIKEHFPGVEVIMGGTIFSQDLYPDTPNFHRFLEQAECVDRIFIGEGELLFLKYLVGELPSDQKVFQLSDIDVQLINVEENLLPDYSDFEMNNYPMLPTYTSRGCVYKCSFCAETIYWRKYRKKTAIKVVNEFTELWNQYHRKVFLLTDCLINPLATALAQEIIARDLPFYWDVYLKVDHQVCDPEIVRLWRQGGFYRARLGIESGSQHLLNIIEKGITLDQIKRSLINLATAGIKTTTYWIAGHPGETEEDFQQTLDLLEELQDYIYEAECDPFRYFYRGQVNGSVWAAEKGNRLLYREDFTNMLVTQTWTLNEEPNREVMYNRLCRFKEHCIKLGIPNPYSLSEIQEADRRWSQLQKNTVPELILLNSGYMEDRMNFVEYQQAKPSALEEVDFGF